MFLASREEAFRPGKKLAACGCGRRRAFGQIRPLRGCARLAGRRKTTTAAAPFALPDARRVENPPVPVDPGR